MADIKTTHTMDRFSPLGKYIYQAAQTSGKYVAHYRTNAFVDVRISSAYITQYASHGNKIERPTIEISGEVHGVSGIFSDKKRNLAFSENERPIVNISYEVSDTEMMSLIDNGLYRRDNYARLFSDILEGKQIGFEAPVEYLSIDFEDDDKQIIILDTTPMVYQKLDDTKVDFPFDEPFDIIDEIQTKESARPASELESIEDKAHEEKRNAFFEKLGVNPVQEDEFEDDDEYGFDGNTSSISGEQIFEEPMFDDLLEDDEPLFDDKSEPTIEPDDEEISEFEGLDKEQKKDEKTIYEKDDDFDFESVDKDNELDDFEW